MQTTINEATKIYIREKDLVKALDGVISVRFLQQKRISGGGPPYIKMGKVVVYKLPEVLKWIEAQKRTSTSDPGPSDEI